MKISCCILLLFVFVFTVQAQAQLDSVLEAVSPEARDAIRDERRSSKKKYRSHQVSPGAFQDLRFQLLQELGSAENRHDGPAAAKTNSLLAAEAFSRAKAAFDFWMRQQDPSTLLFPSYLYSKIKFWDYRNSAADLFPFLLIAAFYFDDQAYARLLDALGSESRLSQTQALPHTVILGDGILVDEGPEEQIFGAAEYIKDGLIPITEQLGRGPWLDRMAEVMEKIWAAAAVKTSQGIIPSSLAEPNGDILQGLCRLYAATGKDMYLLWAERLADVYLFDVLPRSGYLPPKDWDFSNGRFGSDQVWLRDHGNELITGLVELACLECLNSRPKCSAYLPPLLRMTDLLLKKGRNPDGLWVNALDQKGRQLKMRKGQLCDNWGYLYAAYLALSQILERDAAQGPSALQYRSEVKRTLENLHKYPYFPWERKFEMDGQADSLESALYLLNRIPVKSAFNWLESEMGVLFSFQKPDGSINKDYLDGNFIRTSLLYALYKTGGTYLKPWREDVRLGAAISAEGLHIHIASSRPWQGKLYFDHPRHEVTSPANIPRVNEWPEWFTVQKQGRYQVTNLEGSSKREFQGSELISGIAVDLADNRTTTVLVEKAQ